MGLGAAVNLTDISLRYIFRGIDSEPTDIRPLASLTNLTTLDLRGTQVGNISALSPLTKLVVLGLRETEVSDLSALSSLTNLTELDLSVNPISTVHP